MSHDLAPMPSGANPGRLSDLMEQNGRLIEEVERLVHQVHALRESERDYRIIFEESASGIAQVSLDKRFLNCNRRLAEMLGYTREELCRLRFPDITHPDDVARDMQNYHEMISGVKYTYSTEKRYRCNDGSYLWTHLTVSVVRQPDGTPQHFVSVVQDISQLKRAEELLRKSEQRLQSILDHTTAVIYIKDVDGRYELINRCYEEIFHLSRESIIGKTDFEIFTPEWAQHFRSNDLHVLESGKPLKIEEYAPLFDGVHAFLSIKVPILDASGKPVSLCGISSDITERKQAEHQLVQAKEAAEQASLAKSRFLANISHEIRTPIMAMLGSAELICEGRLTTQQTTEHADVVLRNGRHLLSLVDDLLDQSREDASRLDVSLKPCVLPEVLADVFAVTSPLVGRKPIEFRVMYQSAIPETILTDRTRLTQAVVNLVHNAIKFTGSGLVRVTVRVDRAEPGAFLVISVDDTGPGIPQTDLQRIFEPFVQVGNPQQQTAVAGVGLGLSVARSIAQRLGGTLEVESQVGVGSRFTLRIPLGPPSDTRWIEPEAASQWQPVHIGQAEHEIIRFWGTVLLAEDADDVRKLLEHVLRAAGATVLAVADGRAAVDSVRPGDPTYDLILLDIRMPQVNGLDAAREIRRRGYGGPLIALTASTTQEEHQHILSAGFDEVWAKPIRLSDFLELVSAYMHPIGPSNAIETAPPVQSSPALSEGLAAARQEFVASLPQKTAALEAAVRGGQVEDAGEILHQLAGSSGIHGFGELSIAARAASRRLRHACGLSPDSAELTRLLNLAREAMAQG